ncbi:hypothetical protein [Bacillus cereus group sp. TH260-2LC]|uniref:hypothetical protein n=1 Tax=unclassified Bacillus cereus group TaxID=2750818 RepID=UPI0022E90665|nr:hypothetical protein [Bacillus cereus group sp. TH260-2LC]MDA1527231.1 hypothetical protein [Bacillus cereus group sp. TH260-2LC]
MKTLHEIYLEEQKLHKEKQDRIKAQEQAEKEWQEAIMRVQDEKARVLEAMKCEGEGAGN